MLLVFGTQLASSLNLFLGVISIIELLNWRKGILLGTLCTFVVEHRVGMYPILPSLFPGDTFPIK